MTDVSGNDGPDDLISSVRIEDEIPRTRKYINSCNFTDAQLLRRGHDLQALAVLYPNTCVSHLELAWNFCEFTDDKELEAIRLEKRWEGKPKERQMGGVLKNAMSICSREELEIKS